MAKRLVGKGPAVRPTRAQLRRKVRNYLIDNWHLWDVVTPKMIRLWGINSETSSVRLLWAPRFGAHSRGDAGRDVAVAMIGEP